ncbi:putative 50S ribosomal protein L1 [Cocos nucifera]|uniref:Putative 50S ribosomal protein L1 n=1 Tax=Cocos nucifera TaxID=13894 RepID=A0A8K0MYV3_COCNU|nr:putative 50S ribosomal protein L1 [Cocos nucifera]
MDLMEAIREVKANAKHKFVETVEAHVNLSVDPHRGDQANAKHKFVETVEAHVNLSVDPHRGDQMVRGALTLPHVTGKIVRILGPCGLMPNPKLGSVTSDVSGAVKEAKCGRIDFKIDKTAIVHARLGKVHFSEESLRENIGAFVHAFLLAKPVGLKRTSKYAGYVKNFTLSSMRMKGNSITADDPHPIFLAILVISFKIGMLLAMFFLHVMFKNSQDRH